MAGPFKGQFFINQFNQGWVETWYTTAADLTSAAGQFVSLANGLMGPRSVESVLVSIRVSEDKLTGKRAVRHFPTNIQGHRPPAGVMAQPEDVVATAAMVTASFADGTQKTLLLRGLEDADVERDPVTGAPVPSAGLRAELNGFFASLAALRIAGRRQDQAQPKVPVTFVQANTDPSLTDLLGPGSGSFAVADVAHLGGMPLVKIPWAKGNWSVLATQLARITIRYPFPLLLPVAPTGGFAQKVAYLYPLFADAVFVDFRTRQTGRPTGATRGRARGVPYRRSLRVGG